MKRRALLSVYDKTGLVEFAQKLQSNFELVASGGTARILVEAGLEVISVEKLTGQPEILDGRVKTLHPAIHAGILARNTPEDQAELKKKGWRPFDLVVCNLYPFQETVAKLHAPVRVVKPVGGISAEEAEDLKKQIDKALNDPSYNIITSYGVSWDAMPLDEVEQEIVEKIDIGGVALLRAAAKNFREGITVLTDPKDYEDYLLKHDRQPSLEARRKYAKKVFKLTSEYDTAIQLWMGDEPALPLAVELHSTLRYGENPHQEGELRVTKRFPFTKLQGKELGWNNWIDLDAAWACVSEFTDPAVVIVKHTNPCGVAVSQDGVEIAFKHALICDPISAFGSVIAVNQIVTEDFVEALGELFVEVIVAPSFTGEALVRLHEKKKNCRVVLAGPMETRTQTRSICEGFLIQDQDNLVENPSEWRCVTKQTPTPKEHASMVFAWKVAKHLKSNAIVIALGTRALGIGAGQMNRVRSVGIALEQAGVDALGSVLASDGFFPFDDNVVLAGLAGVSAIVQPGGSIRDQEVIDAADKAGIAMLLTGVRHFKH